MCPFHCIFWARLFSFSQNSLPLLLSIHSREVFSSTIGLLRPFIFILLCMSPWEKAMAPHSSTLAWRIPGTGESGGLPSMGLHRVGHDWSDLAAAAEPESLEEMYYVSVTAFTLKLWGLIRTHCSFMIKAGQTLWVSSSTESPAPPWTPLPSLRLQYQPLFCSTHWSFLPQDLCVWLPAPGRLYFLFFTFRLSVCAC